MVKSTIPNRQQYLKHRLCLSLCAQSNCEKYITFTCSNPVLVGLGCSIASSVVTFKSHYRLDLHIHGSCIHRCVSVHNLDPCWARLGSSLDLQRQPELCFICFQRAFWRLQNGPERGKCHFQFSLEKRKWCFYVFFRHSESRPFWSLLKPQVATAQLQVPLIVQK